MAQKGAGSVGSGRSGLPPSTESDPIRTHLRRPSMMYSALVLSEQPTQRRARSLEAQSDQMIEEMRVRCVDIGYARVRLGIGLRCHAKRSVCAPDLDLRPAAEHFFVSEKLMLRERDAGVGDDGIAEGELLPIPKGNQNISHQAYTDSLPQAVEECPVLV